MSQASKPGEFRGSTLWCNLCNVPYSLLDRKSPQTWWKAILLEMWSLQIRTNHMLYHNIWYHYNSAYSLLIKALKSFERVSLLFANKQPNKSFPLEKNANLLGIFTTLASVTWPLRPVMSCMLSDLYRFLHRLPKNETIRQCAKCQVWVVQRVCWPPLSQDDIFSTRSRVVQPPCGCLCWSLWVDCGHS